MDHLSPSPLLGTHEDGRPGLATATWSVKRYSCLLLEQSTGGKEVRLDKLDVKSSSQRIKYACHGPTWINLNNKAE